MWRLWISLLALSVASVWATAVASAEGTPFAFEDTHLDAVGPANAWADLVAGHAEIVDDTLVATVSVAVLPELQPGVAYIFVFSDGTNRWFVGAATTPSVDYYYGRWSDQGPLSMEPALSGSYSPGPGGSVTAAMPLGALGDATVISKPGAQVWDVKAQVAPTGVDPVLLDAAEGDATLALPSRGETPPAEPAPAPEVEGAEEVAPAAVAQPPAEEPPARSVPSPAGLLALAAAALAARRSR